MSPPGRLLLVPNALDFGLAADALPPLDEQLPRETLRAAAGLHHWACENAKSARAFLKRVQACVPLAAPLQSLALAELPRPPKGRGEAGALPPAAWEALLAPTAEGHDLGLLSEAGLPAVADPGAGLVAAAHRRGIAVQVLPGSSAITLALAASGLQGQCYAFVGYLPVDAAARRQRIRELEARAQREGQTQQMIETPYRNPALLAALLDALQPRTRLAVSCGLGMPGGFTRSDSVAGWRRMPADLPTDRPAVFSLLA
ncbi:SAM-dependent methyltransferase [Piscinibacter sakaiensis]|uniref:Tetrapyrrole methylase family protein n=1 Tax=Piscinibacter sakaiensis TaxID=1547922 RepID=A0A0K8NTF9_PISS1|nr:SAM-dependent methyltransferase [Piscinibacter sakaiensis]GAP33574.1 tetrapyrrole methylase family protein [Piscinibacter sakaiensis]